jgi:putative thioredoxin
VEVARGDRTYMDDVGRRACLALFSFLGNENPVTAEYRRALAATLF